MARILETLKGPFSFLFARPQKEELVAEYIVREHHRGRALDDILDDPYVTNRCSPDQVSRVLEQPEVVHAIGEDIVAERRSKL